MAVECTSRSYAQELQEKERLAEQQRTQALESGDMTLVEESQRVLELAEDTRKAFRKAGVSLHLFKVLRGNDSSDGTIAMGAYQQEAGRVGAVGLAELEDFDRTATKQPVTDQVEATIAHELRHQKSHANALSRGESGVIRTVLGADLDHDLQEAMASQGTTEGMDAYDPERARASQFAARIGMARSQVSRLLMEGREGAIVQAALEKGWS